jgi:hypothetical protein
MNLKQIFAKQGPLVNWWTFGLAIFCFAGSIYDLGQGIRVHDRVELLFAIPFVCILSCCWSIVTIRRLIEVGWLWHWVIPLAAIYAVAVVFAIRGDTLVVRELLGVVLVLQLPLMFLSPKSERKDHDRPEVPKASA